MTVRFVMFPSGIMLFPETASPEGCSIAGKSDKPEKPTAAGFVGLEGGHREPLDAIVLTGESKVLGLSFLTAYPDWRDRHRNSGFPPLARSYARGEVYALPFGDVRRFSVVAMLPVVRNSMREASLKEVIAYLGGR